VGHVVWTRKALLARLGTEWSEPWLGMFARGAKCEDGAAYPSPDALLDAWREVSSLLAGAPSTRYRREARATCDQRAPSSDGKESGIVDFLAIHETYHIGQASYLRGWLGHKGLMDSCWSAHLWPTIFLLQEMPPAAIPVWIYGQRVLFCTSVQGGSP